MQVTSNGVSLKPFNSTDVMGASLKQLLSLISFKADKTHFGLIIFKQWRFNLMHETFRRSLAGCLFVDLELKADNVLVSLGSWYSLEVPQT